MIDTWFKSDLQNIFDNHTVAVFIDESGDAEFLLKTVKNECTIYRTDSDVEELHIKYLIEKVQPSNEKFLVYTRTRKDDLKFIREYCETNGCLEIRYLQNYIKGKVHETLNLNINIPQDELIAAAKVSVDKDRTYWLDLCHKGADGIFDMEKELLPFLDDPEAYSREKYDPQLREIFYRKVNEVLGQEYLSKPATTLAGEVVNAMLDGLARDNCNKLLEYVYKSWLDSISYRDSFKGHLESYSLPTGLDIWNVSVDHPFRKVDENWMIEIGKNMFGKSDSNILDKIRQRNKSRQAKALGIAFWADVIELLEFDPKDISYLSSFSECVDFYTKHFYKLDTAIRNLYTEFLNKKDLLEPFQELYKEHASVFLDKWFSYWDDYKENQTGTLQRIIDENIGTKTAVIVGDGVAFEIAELVAAKVNGSVSLERAAILADIPSETVNNLSRVYINNGVIQEIQRNREKYLATQNPDISIGFIQLEEVTEDARAEQVLICTYKDIDSMGEKLQHKALKYFPETIDFFAKKIQLLLKIGYGKVYLISDHGFVLTGLLSEADKIEVTPTGKFNKAERYICTEDKQTELVVNLVEVYKRYKDFNNIYFAKNINPFITPGAYGYSHGGLSPQELVTPFFCWEESKIYGSSLSMTIENKQDLSSVTGNLFSIKIQADKGVGDLMSSQRKVYLVFFANKKQTSKSDFL